VDEATARARLNYGLTKLAARVPKYTRRVDYYEGRHDLPYAPPGVNTEYQALREQAVANWLRMIVDAPLQRLTAEGVRVNREGEADGELDRNLWRRVWKRNKLDSRQRITYVDLYMHGHAVVSVLRDEDAPGEVRVRPESWRTTYLHIDPDDVFAHDWALRTYVQRGLPLASNDLPAAMTSSSTADVSVATIYDATEFVRFEKGGDTAGWRVVDSGRHGMSRLPFVAAPFLPNTEGHGVSAVDPLIPQCDAVNTIRFNTLLAMQYAAFRQRVFTGFDPIRRREDGSIVYKVDADGNELLDPATGERIPELNSPGRLGVDRALVFPGADTKVFDLAESNLANYVTVLGEFLADLFAIGQVPPQYLLNRMANLSGDALAGAESTLASLVRDLRGAVEVLWVEVLKLAGDLLGEELDDEDLEILWGDGEARSFAQVVDAVVKLATTGFPKRAQWELIPGATLEKVDRWMELAEEEQAGALTSLLGMADQTGANPLAPAPVDPGLDAASAAQADALAAQAQAAVSSAPPAP
jgi:Phage portal protein, SPP1 Gp6-like